MKTVSSSGFIPALQDYTMIIVALTFLAAGISSVLIAGMGSGRLAKSFAAGLVSIAPSVLMILIPIITPLSQLCGIPMQLAILAFAFGDGFSNVIYPTNAGLLITLGLTDVSYGEWFRYSWRFQLLNLILTCGILLFGLMAGYA